MEKTTYHIIPRMCIQVGIVEQKMNQVYRTEIYFGKKRIHP